MTGPAAHHARTAPDPLAAARRHRVELRSAVQAFEAALAVPAGDPSWRKRVGDRLRDLREAFAEHVTVTEGADGLYAQLLDDTPRLACAVRSLVDEHGALAGAIQTLYADATAGEIERLRERGVDLLRGLARHRQRGADLVYEAYATDIGGET